MAATSDDYEELLKLFNDHDVKYLIVGAHAVIFYSEPRFTKDLDLWVPPQLNDPQKILQALKAFGAPIGDLSVSDLKNEKLIFQIGVAPVRVDLLMAVGALNAKNAWKNRKKSNYGEVEVSILGLEDLIVSKEAAGREQDLLDLKRLKKIKIK